MASVWQPPLVEANNLWLRRSKQPLVASKQVDDREGAEGPSGTFSVESAENLYFPKVYCERDAKNLVFNTVLGSWGLGSNFK